MKGRCWTSRGSSPGQPRLEPAAWPPACAAQPGPHGLSPGAELPFRVAPAWFAGVLAPTPRSLASLLCYVSPVAQTSPNATRLPSSPPVSASLLAAQPRLSALPSCQVFSRQRLTLAHGEVTPSLHGVPRSRCGACGQPAWFTQADPGTPTQSLRKPSF